MENNFYPLGMENGLTKLPIGTNLGKIKIDNATAYSENEILFADKLENPIMFIDIESPREEYKVMKTTQLHLGISGNFKILKKYANPTKHIDIYIPLSEVENLINCLQNKNKTFNPDNWNKVLCEWCGEHARCPKCNKYIWKEKEDDSNKRND